VHMPGIPLDGHELSCLKYVKMGGLRSLSRV
jgi:hypothetical protein